MLIFKFLFSKVSMGYIGLRFCEMLQVIIIILVDSFD